MVTKNQRVMDKTTDFEGNQVKPGDEVIYAHSTSTLKRAKVIAVNPKSIRIESEDWRGFKTILKDKFYVCNAPRRHSRKP
jgi:hypothetical protein